MSLTSHLTISSKCSMLSSSRVTDFSFLLLLLLKCLDIIHADKTLDEPEHCTQIHHVTLYPSLVPFPRYDLFMN